MHSSLPSNYWNSLENRRKFLDEMKLKFNIKEPKDWGNISVKEFQNAGGNSMLKLYGNSLFECLQSIYTGICL